MKSLKIAVALMLAAVGTSASASSLKVGQPVPNFELVLVGGEHVRLSDLRGQVVVLNYWATWCAPCRIEMPILDAYYRQHRGQGLEMLAISIDQGVSTGKLKEVSSKFAFPVAKVDDVRMPRRDIPSAIPVNRIYDKAGRLVFQSKADGRSTIDMATLERVVTPLLR